MVEGGLAEPVALISVGLIQGVPVGLVDERYSVVHRHKVAVWADCFQLLKAGLD